MLIVTEVEAMSLVPPLGLKDTVSHRGMNQEIGIG